MDAEQGHGQEQTSVTASSQYPDARVTRLAEQFERALGALSGARNFAKARYQTDVFRLASDLMDSFAGFRVLLAAADRFEAAGVFHGGPWADASRLLPSLVSGCLRGEGQGPLVEVLSELRMLAIATGRAKSDSIAAEDAHAFLRSVVALNLDLIFVKSSPRRECQHEARARRLFALLAAELSLEGLQRELLDEVDMLCAQRPLSTERIKQLIEFAARLPNSSADAPLDARFERYRGALGPPSPLSREHPDPARYRGALAKASEQAITTEIAVFATQLRETGLGSPYHAVLLRQLAKSSPLLLSDALALSEHGRTQVAQNTGLVTTLVRAAIVPATAGCLYGFARLIERGLLSLPEVATHLHRLVDVHIRPDVQHALLAGSDRDSGLSPNATLLAGAISVLGHPLGVSQGDNPACQAARGISLWSAHAPAYLLQLLMSAAREGYVELELEGTRLRSHELPGGALVEVRAGLDALSTVLVPHLSRLYEAMLFRASGRGDDAHRWINPAMYGRWVPTGFCSAFEKETQTVARYRTFLRRFFATHHPEYNDGHRLIYPNPVGIFVTDVHGNLLGAHAISLQRVCDAPDGSLRVYFYNPNHDGRQQWGRGVSPTVSGHGELPGESSLPFDELASRLYAFHYNPYEEGDAFAVPAELTLQIEQRARNSWGRAFTWPESDA